MHWYLKVLKDYASFSGRAQRAEYWMFTLIATLIGIALVVVDVMSGGFSADDGANGERCAGYESLIGWIKEHEEGIRCKQTSGVSWIAPRGDAVPDERRADHARSRGEMCRSTETARV